MIVENLKQVLAKSKDTNRTLFIRNILKEELQNFILSYIYNSKEYKELLFTGGTCLRKIYGLPRLSEDLDFDYTKDFKVENFSKDIKEYFSGQLQYKNIETKVSGNRNTVFIKFYILKDLGLAESPHSNPVLFVRCDFSKEDYGIFDTEVNSISTRDFTFFALSYDMPTLFANKIGAFLSRVFFKGAGQQTAFKGRDVFDIVWFLEKAKRSNFELKPNWKRLKKMFPDRSREELIDAVVKKAGSIDRVKVYQDLVPFIESETSVKNFSAGFDTVIAREAKNLL